MESEIYWTLNQVLIEIEKLKKCVAELEEKVKERIFDNEHG